MAREHSSRAEAPPGCLGTARTSEATVPRAERGTSSWALRVGWILVASLWALGAMLVAQRALATSDLTG